MEACVLSKKFYSTMEKLNFNDLEGFAANCQDQSGIWSGKTEFCMVLFYEKVRTHFLYYTSLNT